MRFIPFSLPSLLKTDRTALLPSRVLWLSCVAHALHDGYTDMIYALLPVWQADFGLGYGALAMLRGVYAGTMASLQIPAGRLAQRLGSRATLALGTLLAAGGYALAGMSGSLLGLCVALAVSGSGSSTQHPIASGAVSRVYGRRARGPLSVYNFSGDLGKSALPAAISLLVTLMPWRHALWIMSVLGCVVAVSIALFFPVVPRSTPAADAQSSGNCGGSGRGFSMLLSIGVLDTSVRMGLLTFLPFLLKEKGISQPMLGTALALVFIGGAAGKFACGWLGARLGVIGTVLATEGGTAACIVAVMLCPLSVAMVLLPLLGVMLNGTSSVLYGTVPELAPLDGAERAFALFYTGTIASGAISPVIYGFLGDRIGVHGATLATALTATAIFPLAIALRSRLAHEA
ncbi:MULTISPECIES: MFS transporter [unclassified Caballeronia]|uniref:MFS transporter n=1 Tax=unclassified Caballeronia TaxID=2646786 RepID=UPI00285E63EC|nr:MULTISPECIES: MFS transporter [unclassified Caballeronia]MDR5774741.1 MFS transporter [Caballeronia sp. LZ002]MDR5850177.1 MFS transporter [Caballeronia sp. LZ003]